MTSQSKKNESNKLPKRVFSPPVVKSYSTPFGKGELELHGKPEDGVTAKSIINILPVQSKRQKERTAHVEKKSQCKKNLETIENEKECLTDAQFEEIFQSVLQKSPQECMEKFQKRRVSAESAEGQPSSREPSEAFLPAERNGSQKKTEVGRKGNQIKMKKQSKFGADKGENKLNEKAAANNVGCKANRKREPKKAAQGGDAQDVIDPEEAPEEEEEEEEEEEVAGGSGSGRCCTAWVQCSHPSCEKWRRLSSHVDPSALPEDWSCSQNPDLQYNSCSVPEEDWSGSEDEVVYAIYFPGSIVWAKQYGYPWWPGIIEADPDIEEYFLFSSQADSLPSKYHVTFFGHSVTRAWISASQLKNYGEAAGGGSALAKIRNKSEKKDLREALEMAKEAERISIQERIRRFGFHGRFRDKASPRDGKILKGSVEGHPGSGPGSRRSSFSPSLEGSGTSLVPSCILEQNNSASRPPPVKGAPERKGGNKNAAASGQNPEKLLRKLSVVEPNAKVKTTINMKGGQTTKLGPESASPVLKKSRPQRSAPNAAATLRGPDQATGKQKRSQKGWKPSFSPPPCETPRAGHPHSCPDSSSSRRLADMAAFR